MIHTTRAYDEAAFRAWLESEKGRIDMPWDTPNAEHLVVLFTRSILAIKWRRHDDAKEELVGRRTCW